MSKSVDERVVEMQFNNDEFERGVAQTIESMEKLQKSLEIQDSASKSLKSIQASVNSLDLNPIAKGVETISSKFSALGIAGTSALATIASQATTTATSLVSKLVNNTIGQVYSGGLTRAQNIANAKFQLQGLGIEWSEIEEDINYGVKDTAYGLDSAAKVASQLVASQVSIGDDMKTALRGISGVAAMTNSTYDDIGSIFTTVAGNGRLMSDQLNQLASRGLNAASTLGTYLGKTEAEVRTMTSKGEIDFATFAAAMDSAFGQHAKDANQTFSGSLSNMKAALSRIGADVASPALENLTKIFNALKDKINAAHTALAPFIAKINEVQNTLTTKLVNFINGDSASAWDTFVSKVNSAGISTDEFTEKLKEVARNHGVAIDEMIEKQGSLLKTLSSGWLSKDILAETLDDFSNDTTKIGESAEELQSKLEFFQQKVDEVWYGTWDNGQARIDKLTEAGYDYYSIQRLVNMTVDKHRLTLDDLSEAELVQIGYTEDEIAVLNELKAACAETGGSIDDMLESVGKKSIWEMALNAISNLKDSLLNIGTAIKTAFTNVFGDFKGGSNLIYKVVEAFEALTNRFYIGEAATENLTKGFTGIFNIVKLVAEVITGVLSFAFEHLTGQLNKTEGVTLGLFGKFGDLLTRFTDWVHSCETIQDAVDTVAWAIDKVIATISSAIDYIKDSGLWDAVVNVFSKVKDVIVSVISTLKQLITQTKEAAKQKGTYDKLKTSVTELKKAFSQLAEILKSILVKALEKVQEIFGELWDKIEAWIASGQLLDFIERMGTVVSDAVTGASKKISDFWSLFSNKASTTALNSLADISSSFKTVANSGIVSATNNIVGFAQAIQTTFSSGIETGANLLDWFIDKYDNAQQWILDTVGQVSLGSVAAAGLAGSMTYFIITVGQAVTKVSKALTSFLGMGKILQDTLKSIKVTLAGIGDYFTKKGQAAKIEAIGNAMLKLAASILIIVAALAVLTYLDQEKLKTAAGIIASFGIGMGVIFAALTALSSKVGQAEAIAALAQCFISFAGAIAILVGCLKILCDIDTGTLWRNVGVIATIAVVLGAVAIAINGALSAIGELAAGKGASGSKKLGTAKGTSKQMASTAASIVAIGVSVYIIAKAMETLGNMSEEQINRAIPVLIAIGAVVSVMGVLTSLGNSKASVGLIAIALSIGIMVAVLKQLAAIDAKTIGDSIPALIYVLTAFAVLMRITNLAGENAIQAGVALIAMSLAVGLMSFALKKLAEIDTETCLATLPALVTIMGMFTLVILATKLAGENALKAGGALLAMSAAMIIISAAILLMSTIEDEALVRCGAVCAGLMGMMAVVVASTKNSKDATKTFYGMAVAIGVMAAAVAILSLIDPASLGIATACLDSLMLSLAALTYSTGKMGEKTVKNLAVMTAVVAALAGMIYLLAGVDGIQNAISAAAGISLLMIAMAATLKIMSTINSGKDNIKSMAANLGIMTTVVYLLSGVMLILSKIENPTGLIPTVIALDALLLGLSAVCVILQYISNPEAVLTGIGCLAAIITAMSGLLLLIGGLVEVIPGAEEGIQAGVRIFGYIGEALGGLIGNFIETLGDSVLGLLDDLGTHLSAFWENVTPFVNGVQSLDSSFVTNIGYFADGLMKLCGAMLENQFANLLNWFGDSSLVEFAKDLGDFAEEMVNTQEKAADLDLISMMKFANVVSVLCMAVSSMADETSGGIKAIWSGSLGDKFEQLSDGLSKLAYGLGQFGSQDYDIDTQSVLNRTEALKAVIEACNGISTSGGIAGIFNGDIDYTKFGAGLGHLATGLEEFSTNSVNIFTDRVERGAQALRTVVDATSNMTASGGLVQLITGEVDYEAFGSALSGLGSGLEAFSTSSNNIDEAAVNRGVNAINALAEAQSGIDRVNGLVQQVEGTTNFETFAVGVNAMSKALMGMSANMAAVNTESLDTGINYIQRYVGELMPAFEEANYGAVATSIQEFNDTTDKLNNMSQLTTNVAEVTEAVFNALENLLNSVTTTKIKDAYAKFGEELIQKVADGIDRKRTTLTTMMDSIITTLNTYQSKFQTTGLFMMSGLSSGISQGRSKVINAAVQTATEAYQKAQQAVQVNSPSKKFRWLGEMCNLGWELGFTSTADDVANAAENVGIQTLSVVGAAMDNIEAIADSDLTISPVITPVVDLSNIRSSSDMIDSLYSSMNAVSARRNISVISDYEKAARASQSDNTGNTDITNYYFDGINVNGTTDASMAEEIVNVLTKYKRLAAI